MIDDIAWRMSYTHFFVDFFHIAVFQRFPFSKTATLYQRKIQKNTVSQKSELWLRNMISPCYVVYYTTETYFCANFHAPTPKSDFWIFRTTFSWIRESLLQGKVTRRAILCKSASRINRTSDLPFVPKRRKFGNLRIFEFQLVFVSLSQQTDSWQQLNTVRTS